MSGTMTAQLKGAMVVLLWVVCRPPACQAAPPDADALVALADVDVQQGRLERAEARLARALTLRPGDAEVLYKRGVVRLQLDRTEPALQDMTAATSVTTVPGYAFNGLGAVRYVRADYAAALESLRIAAVLRVGDWEVVLNRGLVHLERGDIASAETDLQSVLTACPTDGRAQAAMARLQQRKAEAQQRATEAAQDTSGGVNDPVAVLDAMQKALDAANEARRLATGGLGGLLGKVRGSLNRRGTPPAPRGPFACDAAGRIGPAVSYQPLALPPPQTTEAPTTPATNPPPPGVVNPPAADPFAGEQTAIVAVVAALTQALEARDVEKAGDCFEAAVRPQVKESLIRNQGRLPQIAALLKEARLTYVSAEATTPAGGLTRTAELTVMREDGASYVQMVKLDGQWWVRSL